MRLADVWIGIRRLRDAIGHVWEQTRANIQWYAASTVVHMLLLAAALLILGNLHFPAADIPLAFKPANDDLRVKPALEPMGDFSAPLDPSELDTGDLLHPQFKVVTAQDNGNSANFSERGGGRKNVVGPDGAGFGGFDRPRRRTWPHRRR